MVDEACYPYIAQSSHCKVHRNDTLSSAGCELPKNVPRDHLYRVGPAYSLNNESDIMAEILESGPVQGMNIQNNIWQMQSQLWLINFSFIF